MCFSCICFVHCVLCCLFCCVSGLSGVSVLVVSDWTSAEDDNLRELVQRFGERNWGQGLPVGWTDVVFVSSSCFWKGKKAKDDPQGLKHPSLVFACAFVLSRELLYVLCLCLYVCVGSSLFQWLITWTIARTVSACIAGTRL